MSQTVKNCLFKNSNKEHFMILLGWRVKAFTLFRLKLAMKERCKMACSMAKEHSFLPMAADMKPFGKMVMQKRHANQFFICKYEDKQTFDILSFDTTRHNPTFSLNP